MKATEDKNTAIAQVQGWCARGHCGRGGCMLRSWWAWPLTGACPSLRQAERTSRKAGLADRLVNGLSGEKKRWSETIRRQEAQEGKLVGDVLLAAAFVSYAGPFNMAFRRQLVDERWLPDIVARDIPTSPGGHRVGIGPLLPHRQSAFACLLGRRLQTLLALSFVDSSSVVGASIPFHPPP